MRAGFIVIVIVIGRVLEVPGDFAGGRIEGDSARCVEIVAGAARRIVTRHGIAGAPVGKVILRIIGAGDIESAAAGLPSIDLVFPGLASRFARRGNGEGFPLQFPRRGIERGDPVAHALIAARGAYQNAVFQRERRRGKLDLGLVMQVFLPHDLAGLLVGGDDASVLARCRNNKIAPERYTAMAPEALLSWVHLPKDAAEFLRAEINLVDGAPAIHDVHETVLDERRRLKAFIACAAANADGEFEFEIADIGFVDLRQRGMALRIIGAVHAEPVFRLRILKPFECRVSGARRYGSAEERHKCENARGNRVQHVPHSPAQRPNTKSIVVFFARPFISGAVEMRPT